jgi:uncharacterized membrane protein
VVGFFGISHRLRSPFFVILFKTGFPLQAGHFVLLSGFLEVAYFLGLSNAYTRGDLSLVYPLARSAPVFVPIWAIIFLKEQISLQGFFGILTMILGGFIISMRWNSPFLSSELKKQPYGVALFTALASSVYSIIDKIGVSLVHPIVYIYLVFIVTWIGLGLCLLLFHQESSLLKTWQYDKQSIFIVGLFMTLSYLLVLFALQIGKVSYIIALRQVSIVFGVLLGSFSLKEKHGKTRLLGALVIWLGAAMISLAH